jgi:anionic cell wall polymer biosynthesis LytR-Cps2A-Psr (LCP) family protein
VRGYKEMKSKKVKFFAIALVLLVIFALAGYDSLDDREGQAKTPSASSAQKGKNYQDVIEAFEKKGFTNIKTEVLDNLITGWLTKDGEVKSVSVDGNVDYSADVWYPNDVEVIITYHTFPIKEEATSGSSSA